MSVINWVTSTISAIPTPSTLLTGGISAAEQADWTVAVMVILVMGLVLVFLKAATAILTALIELGNVICQLLHPITTIGIGSRKIGKVKGTLAFYSVSELPLIHA